MRRISEIGPIRILRDNEVHDALYAENPSSDPFFRVLNSGFMRPVGIFPDSHDVHVVSPRSIPNHNPPFPSHSVVGQGGRLGTINFFESYLIPNDAAARAYVRTFLHEWTHFWVPPTLEVGSSFPRFHPDAWWDAIVTGTDLPHYFLYGRGNNHWSVYLLGLPSVSDAPDWEVIQELAPGIETGLRQYRQLPDPLLSFTNPFPSTHTITEGITISDFDRLAMGFLADLPDRFYGVIRPNWVNPSGFQAGIHLVMNNGADHIVFGFLDSFDRIGVYRFGFGYRGIRELNPRVSGTGEKIHDYAPWSLPGDKVLFRAVVHDGVLYLQAARSDRGARVEDAFSAIPFFSRGWNWSDFNAGRWATAFVLDPAPTITQIGYTIRRQTSSMAGVLCSVQASYSDMTVVDGNARVVHSAEQLPRRALVVEEMARSIPIVGPSFRGFNSPLLGRSQLEPVVGNMDGIFFPGGPYSGGFRMVAADVKRKPDGSGYAFVDPLQDVDNGVGVQYPPLKIYFTAAGVPTLAPQNLFNTVGFYRLPPLSQNWRAGGAVKIERSIPAPFAGGALRGKDVYGGRDTLYGPNIRLARNTDSETRPGAAGGQTAAHVCVFRENVLLTQSEVLLAAWSLPLFSTSVSTAIASLTNNLTSFSWL